MGRIISFCYVSFKDHIYNYIIKIGRMFRRKRRKKMDFKEKYGPWALVVGASQGLGECFARELASRGLNVVICARTLSKLEKVEASIKEDYGFDVRIVRVDISEEDCGDKLIAEIDDLDIGFIIFNAAIEPGGPFIRIKPEDHLKNIVGNCITPTKVVWPLARKMAAKGKGGIYLVSSIAGEGGIANWVSYGAGKSYELILGEGLWYELKAYGVDAGTYVVGATETPNYRASKDNDEADLSGELEAINTLKMPRTPAFVASYLFDQIGTGPRLYSHPDDFENATKMRMMPRDQYVDTISAMTTKYFAGAYNELLDAIG